MPDDNRFAGLGERLHDETDESETGGESGESNESEEGNESREGGESDRRLRDDDGDERTGDETEVETEAADEREGGGAQDEGNESGGDGSGRQRTSDERDDEPDERDESDGAREPTTDDERETETIAERTDDGEDRDEQDRDERTRSERSGGPAFAFDRTTAKSIYVRPETVQLLEDVEFEVESLLRRRHDVRDVTGREFHDAMIHVLADRADEVAERIVETRGE